MIDHTGLQVSNPAVSRAFYEKALEPLGYRVLMDIPREFTGGKVVLGFGEPPKPDFWVAEGPPEHAPAPHRVPCVEPRGRGRLLSRRDRRRRQGQRTARAAAALPRALLRSVRARPRRTQHR